MWGCCIAYILAYLCFIFHPLSINKESGCFFSFPFPTLYQMWWMNPYYSMLSLIYSVCQSHFKLTLIFCLVVVGMKIVLAISVHSCRQTLISDLRGCDSLEEFPYIHKSTWPEFHSKLHKRPHCKQKWKTVLVQCCTVLSSFLCAV